MMPWQVVAAIRARLEAEWTQTPVSYPREDFTRPLAFGEPAPFVRFEPDNIITRRIGVSRLYDKTGRVLLVVLAPTTTSGAEADRMRSDLAETFTDWGTGEFSTEVEEDNADSGKDDSGNYHVSYIALRWQMWGG